MNKRTKTLVIGYGSIGQRHTRTLDQLGHRVAVVTSAQEIDLPRFASIADGLNQWLPDYVVIANDTRLHAQSIATLVEYEYDGITLVEKPLFAATTELDRLPAGPVYVGYNLRFHPLIQKIVAQLEGRPIWTLSVYVGQFLPEWRPQSDYRQSYSARLRDGGVIRDLSHELDYAQVLGGDWRRTVAAGGHLSDLEIESEDAVTLLIECARCSLVSVHLNYLDRIPTRKIFINGPGMTISADLISGEYALNQNREVIVVDRDHTIREQHFAALSGDDRFLCGIDDGLTTMRLIDAAHKSLETSAWVAA